MVEPEKSWLTVVGTGPGSPDYLTPAAREAASQARVLIGGTRALGLFEHLRAEKFLLTGDLGALAVYLRKIHGQPTAVLVSGDPGFYSLLPWLKKQFPREKIRVIPGVSSIQLAFARLGATWERATFVSLHGRDIALLEPYLPELRQGEAKLAVLAGGRNSPAAVGLYLENNGLGEYPVWIGAALGTSVECCLMLKASELAGRDLPDAVMVLGYD
ncbi:precorrin-6y C5,15-methyltransferase (decarboxylating) subunit CbiE [Pelotomaculum isophthalicicum JI]|uniref:Precorrin-6y C5,15-methyltransferase (Decarboxylating) subunit CbiE n=1 Tax=Pelotomaculum isophthalicicum JI TaxID=947010 RepID=A0A9X4H6F7_9FIRM|nr:precorrin-6y C5,15-methyltransferase (decarboxylating) subunit CbiE [Pelotomaculum isophthalicicum]MDF9408843.1 precorrin-6y C5,15-methyltransferase (decarboxylating) subunit CbiE [Pelotomaculum isophthalicicum JI]